MAYETSDKVPLGSNDVAVGLTRGVFGSHLGVAFHSKAEGPKLLHLATHQILHFEPYGAKEWIASIVPFELTEAIQFIALARNYAALHVGSNGPNYGINLLAGKGAIDSQGKFSPSKGSEGFTCASIVAEIFNASGFEVVELRNWPTTHHNRKWGQAIVEMLRSRNATADHINAVANAVDGLRLLPEEFAAAAERSSEHWPALYADVEPRAEVLAEEIATKCGPALKIPEDHPLAKAVKIYQQTGKACATIVPAAHRPVASLVTAQPTLFTQTNSAATMLRGVAAAPKVGRNDLCPCKSGKKYKKCHGASG